MLYRVRSQDNVGVWRAESNSQTREANVQLRINVIPCGKFCLTLENDAREISGLRWKTERRSVFGNMVSERTISNRCYTMFFKLADTASKRTITD